MFCTICKKYGKGSVEKACSFVTGCANLRIETIKYHEEKSLFHKRCVEIHRAKSTPRGESSAAKIVEKLNQKAVDRLTVMFCNVHALVQHRRPFTDYPWMLELDKKKGIDVGNTYHTDKEAQKFSFYIAQEARNNITKFINKYPFISVITDGATDKSVKEQEIVYYRSSNGGLVDSFYIGIGEPERADANGIISVIDSDFGSLDIKDYRHKLVGFGSDGASVNTGKKNGVIAKLKESQPCIVGVHCHTPFLMR